MARTSSARQTAKAAPATTWRSAYALAQANAILFFVLSAFAALFSVTSVPVNFSIAVVFFLGSIMAFIALVRAGGGISAISYFVLGVGIYFGFGTAYSVIGAERVFVAYFSQDQQETWLRSINLLNSLSVTTVILAARPWSIEGPQGGVKTSEITETLPFIGTLRIAALLLSVPIILLMLATFPRPGNQLLANAMGLLKQIPTAALVLSGIQWKTSRLVGRASAVAILAALMLLGLVGLSKTDVIVPVIGLFAGLLLSARSPRRIIPAGIVILLVYAFAAAPVVNEGRAYPTYRAENTMAQRLEIVGATWDLLGQSQGGGRQAQPFWSRVGLAPVQAFLIQQHEVGHQGNSFEGAWEAMVPRVIWPDKPIVTRFGEDLDAYFFRRANSGSALAPTYTAEIVWNLGWPGVVWVSALIGLEIGWLTRKWNQFTRNPTANIGILVFALPAILIAGRAETWVVPAFVGGFITLVISIKALDIGMPALTSLSRRRSMAPGFSARIRTNASP